MENGNQTVTINALVVAMESMLEEIKAHGNDVMSLSAEDHTKIGVITAALENGISECNAFLNDGDFRHVEAAGRAMTTAQEYVGNPYGD